MRRFASRRATGALQRGVFANQPLARLLAAARLTADENCHEVLVGASTTSEVLADPVLSDHVRAAPADFLIRGPYWHSTEMVNREASI
jgi:hypothetical protein